jgi:hypothetical protein
MAISLQCIVAKDEEVVEAQYFVPRRGLKILSLNRHLVLMALGADPYRGPKDQQKEGCHSMSGPFD